MYDAKYWQRRVSANTQPLAAGDLKLLLGSIFTELDKINEQIQSMGSKRSRSSSKKLEAGSDAQDDSSGDA